MTTNDQSPRHEAAFFTTIRSWGIARGEHGVFGGVVEGVGDRIGLDRVPARIIAVVLLFLTQGFFLALYAAAWALLPDRSGRIVIQDFGRGTPNVGALIMIAILGMLGLGSNPRPWSLNGDWGSLPFGGLWALIPLSIAVGAVVLVIVLITRSSRPPSGQGPMAIPPQRASAAAKPGHASSAQAASAQAAFAQAASAQAPSTATPGDGAGGDDAAPAQAPTTPPPPPRPRTPGPGSAIYLLTLSAAVLAAAAIWLLDREGRLEVSPIVAWLAVAVVIIGAAMVLAGATGRRIGFLGFLATTFIIGWLMGLTVVPRVFDFADGGTTITIDGVAHTIGNGHGWFDQDADGVSCGSYSLRQGEIAGAPEYVLAPGETSVTVTTSTATVIVPNDASLTFASEGLVDGSLSIRDSDVTCDLDRARGALYSVLRTGDMITVNIASPDAIIAIKGN